MLHRSETPILAAERKIFKEQRESGKKAKPVYVTDRINRKSTYKKDFVDYKKQSKNPQKSKPKRQQSPHKIVGGKKEGISLTYSHSQYRTGEDWTYTCSLQWSFPSCTMHMSH